MLDEREQTSEDGVFEGDGPANSDVHAFALQPVEEGKSWELSAMVVASVLAAGGVLFGVSGCTPRLLTGSPQTMGRNYDRSRPESDVDRKDSTTQDSAATPLHDDTSQEQQRGIPGGHP